MPKYQKNDYLDCFGSALRLRTILFCAWTLSVNPNIQTEKVLCLHICANVQDKLCFGSIMWNHVKRNTDVVSLMDKSISAAYPDTDSAAR